MRSVTGSGSRTTAGVADHDAGTPESARCNVDRIENPLHRSPARPIVGADGRIRNPLGPSRPVELDDDSPVAADGLAPDTTYRSPGFEYLTDEFGLPARVRGALRLVTPGERVRHRTEQRAAGRLASADASVFHGGHIVAVSLGGYASGPNLFPQQQNFNVAAYQRLENGWRRALADGATVEVDIALTLDPDPYVPAFVVVTYWEDGEDWEHPLLNEPEAQ